MPTGHPLPDGRGSDSCTENLSPDRQGGGLPIGTIDSLKTTKPKSQGLNKSSCQLDHPPPLWSGL